jgi:hypothetical protein
MPGYKGHLVGGIVAFCILFVVAMGINPSYYTAGEWLLCTLAGALFPDIDVKSKGQKYFYYVVLAGLVFLVMQREFEVLTCFSFIVITPMLVRHRGIFHSPRFIILMPLMVWIMIAMVFPSTAQPLFFDTMFFIAGAFSHLWLDFGTRQMMYKLTYRKKKW